MKRRRRAEEAGLTGGMSLVLSTVPGRTIRQGVTGRPVVLGNIYNKMIFIKLCMYNNSK